MYSTGPLAAADPVHLSVPGVCTNGSSDHVELACPWYRTSTFETLFGWSSSACTAKLAFTPTIAACVCRIVGGVVSSLPENSAVAWIDVYRRCVPSPAGP